MIYGDLCSFQRDDLETQFYSKAIRTNRPLQIMIVDEIDSMLIDKGQNMLYLPHDLPGLDLLEPLLVEIW